MVARPYFNTVKSETSLFYDTEPKAVPIPLIVEAISKCDYASPLSLALQLRFITGCRGKELDTINPNKQSDGFIYWQLGKNQTKQYRREYVPTSWWDEYDEYRHKYGVPREKLFHISNETLRCYFTKNLRPLLSEKWHNQHKTMRAGRLVDEYVYTWGGIRKTFQTLLFSHYWKQYDDPGVALEMTSKRMKHSSTRITFKHYIENSENINAKDYLNILPFKLVRIPRQENLHEYLV